MIGNASWWEILGSSAFLLVGLSAKNDPTKDQGTANLITYASIAALLLAIAIPKDH